MANSQIPLHFNIFGQDGKMTQPWAFWFQNFTSNLPPSGSGYVVDGSAGTYGQMTIFQGSDADKPVPVTGYVYIATDTGKIYVVVGGAWVTELPAFTGDVTKPIHSTVLTLNNVNPAVGTWGSTTEYPVITVNAKGLVTNVTTETVAGAGSVPGGTNAAVQFNNSGIFGGAAGVTYNQVSNTLTVGNLVIPLGGSVMLNNATIDSFLYTDGTRLVKSTAPATNGEILIGSTGVVPVKGTITAGAGIQVTNGAGSITVKTTGQVDVRFDYGDATPKNIFVMPANKVILQTQIIIFTAFDDVTSTLSLGDAGDTSRFIATTDNVPSQEGTYTTTPGTKYGVDTQVTLSIAPGTSTQGSGLVTIIYEL